MATQLDTTPQPAVTTVESPGDIRSGTRPDTHTWLLERIDGRVAAVVGIAWWVLFGIAQAIEPAPANPNAVPGWIESAISVVFLATLAVMLPGLVARRRWGLLGSLAASVVFVAATIACPTTGHHDFGLWWLGEMACAAALLGLSVATLKRA
jgi:hypothetical protein